ncbi:MAG: glycosyltransferase family 2 protein [Parvularcula sp.]|jgi:GT2 family glycosyltransferase|nr:glycosyltransferase family 2 protein [Parvularcula sp.]
MQVSWQENVLAGSEPGATDHELKGGEARQFALCTQDIGFWPCMLFWSGERQMSTDIIGVVVIGRNEGERLKRCLRSIPFGYPVVYVDSGSSDDSVIFARSTGAIVVELDKSLGFTAARARNAGWRRLLEHSPQIAFVQFVDGDCEVAADWFDKALATIETQRNLAIVFGRRRERFPEKSIYNRLCDDEWNVPLGLVAECGGDALMRAKALQEANGYSDDLIAGEEPDLCLRLSRSGWQFRRIDAEMTLHDANILRISSWWRRAKRAGFAYAAHVWRHGEGSLPAWRRALRSILFWGLALPLGFSIMVGTLAPFAPDIALLLLVALMLIYLMQIIRIALRKRGSGQPWQFAAAYAGLVVLGKFAEASGVLKCWLDRMFDRRHRLIEYK